MRSFDFSSWQSILMTLIGLALFTLISMGIRLVMMFTIQRRRERMNRQINERLRTLIAAYKTLGGSFTGDLSVSPAHRRDARRIGSSEAADETETGTELSADGDVEWDRPRRIRDAVEASLSDIMLLGTEEQVRLAERAVRDLVAGRSVRTHDLVISLRDFIREALDLAPVPSDLKIPAQGPARPSSSGGRSKGERGGVGGRGGGSGGGSGSGGMGGGGSSGGGFLTGSSEGHKPDDART